LSRHNDMQTIDYKVKFLSWSKDRYQIELEGRYGDFKFNRISVEAAVDKTEIVRIRYSTSRTLYVALTPIDPEDQPLKGIIPPKAIVKPMPSYPSELINNNDPLLLTHLKGWIYCSTKRCVPWEKSERNTRGNSKSRRCVCLRDPI